MPSAPAHGRGSTTRLRKSAVVTHYHYAPSPAQKGSDGINGGTDAISVAADGSVYVAHSNPDVSLPGANNTAATYTLTLQGTTAKLTPLYGVNDTARVINRAKGAPATEKLGLTDPDSNRWIQGPHGGVLLQDAQADSKLVVVANLEAKKPTLGVLNLANARPNPHAPATHPAAGRHRPGGRQGRALRCGPEGRQDRRGADPGWPARHALRQPASQSARNALLCCGYCRRVRGRRMWRYRSCGISCWCFGSS
jgi:hypothetical protein